MKEALRKALVVIVGGPFVLVVGTAWFSVAAPMAYIYGLMIPAKPWWLWRYCWAFSTMPFFGFWCLLTGHIPPQSEFWRRLEP